MGYMIDINNLIERQALHRKGFRARYGPPVGGHRWDVLSRQAPCDPGPGKTVITSIDSLRQVDPTPVK